MRGPELPALLRSQPQYLGEGSGPAQCGARPLLVSLPEKVQKLCGRAAEWSLREDCFRQGPRGPEYYYSPEGGREKKNRRINENVETHNQDDVNAREPRDKTAIQDKTKCLRTNYGPITSCRQKKAQGWET